jgi:hypothetical protein
MELKLSRCMSLLERCHEFAPEELAENSYREEELVPLGGYPVRVIPRQATGGNDTVNVGMML